MDNALLPAMANFMLCMGIGFVAFCRLNGMHGSVLRRVQVEYVVYLTFSIASGLRPWWWHELPGWPALIMPSALLVGLLCSSYAWDGGPPRLSVKDECKC